MRIIVSGSRNFTDTAVVESHLAHLFDALQPTQMLSGAARGVDTIAEAFARKRGIPITRYPYRSELGKAGGPARNAHMVADGDVLIAFPTKDSKGTRDIITKATRAGLPVHIIEV